MTTINLATNDQLLSIVSQPIIAAGDEKTVLLQVELDSAWDGLTKSAVFHTSENPTVYEVLLESGECVVPWEVLVKECKLYIGIRGVDAVYGLVKTSSLVKYKIVAGAQAGEATAQEPTPDVYQQILTGIGNKISYSDVVDNLESTATNLPLSAKQGNVLKGNIDKINNENILPTYNSFSFKEMGWYRIAKITSSNISTAQGSQPSGVDIQIMRTYVNSVPEMHRITMITYYNGTAFRNEISRTVQLLFTKVRHTYDKSTFESYIEVYYGSNVLNDAMITLSNQMRADGAKWELITPELTAESDSNVAVTTTSTFSTDKSYEIEVDAINDKLSTCIAIDNHNLYIENASTTLVTLQINKVYLVNIFSSYNVGSTFIIQTGNTSEKCAITVLNDGNFFTLEPVGQNSFNVISGNATGRLTAIPLR